MVEMRWLLEDGEEYYSQRLDMYTRGPVMRVLQYRVYSHDTERAPVSSWSEWRDVPEVGIA